MKELKLIKCNESRAVTAEEKKLILESAAEYYGKFMTALGFDWPNDPNAKDTPMRVAKAFVNDIFEGCYNAAPKITAFKNTEGYFIVL